MEAVGAQAWCLGHQPPLCTAGLFTAEERKAFEKHTHGVHRRIAKWVDFAPFRRMLLWVGETRVGGKQIFASILRPVMKTATAKMGFADRSCLEVSHPEYLQKIVPEALKQQNAMPWIQDLALFLSPWPFDVRQIPEALQGATHLWHGTGDTLVRVGGLDSLQLPPGLGSCKVVDLSLCNCTADMLVTAPLHGPHCSVVQALRLLPACCCRCQTPPPEHSSA